MTRAILVNSELQTITLLPDDFNPEDITQFYDTIPCDCFQIITVRVADKTISIFCDEEYNLHHPLTDNPGFYISTNSLCIMGNAIILGTADDEGVSLSCPFTLEQLSQHLIFARFDKRPDFSVAAIRPATVLTKQ